jgi:hypothetical protein
MFIDIRNISPSCPGAEKVVKRIRDIGLIIFWESRVHAEHLLLDHIKTTDNDEMSLAIGKSASRKRPLHADNNWGVFLQTLEKRGEIREPFHPTVPRGAKKGGGCCLV